MIFCIFGYLSSVISIAQVINASSNFKCSSSSSTASINTHSIYNIEDYNSYNNLEISVWNRDLQADYNKWNMKKWLKGKIQKWIYISNSKEHINIEGVTSLATVLLLRQETVTAELWYNILYVPFPEIFQFNSAEMSRGLFNEICAGIFLRTHV